MNYAQAHTGLGNPGRTCKGCGERGKKMRWALSADAPRENLFVDGTTGQLFSASRWDYVPRCLDCAPTDSRPELEEMLRQEYGQVTPRLTCLHEGCEEPPTTRGYCGKHRGKPERRMPPEPLPDEDVMRIMARVGFDPMGKRNRALICLMWRAGLRIAEVLALRTEDIDFEYWTIRVLHGKGDKARTVKLVGRYAREAVLAWQQERLELRLHHTAPFICTAYGTAVKGSYVREMLSRVAREAGVTRRVHPHAFRHAFAVELHRRRVPVAHIQRLLGHASLSTTQTYLATLSPEDAFTALDEAFGEETA